ncbi:hypothetical protein OF829_08985 [Sphingomonas sp. LB-2]|uniref:hypothetical protein n=1 Tax=Sphingomonas caeni TaxID=2984949 RepID=UPI002230CA90|nr:hypothetical protein [Sphingomonas caeni]MCW3847375.1 hypothetical protein [Sphingomonas caeni]
MGKGYFERLEGMSHFKRERALETVARHIGNRPYVSTQCVLDACGSALGRRLPTQADREYARGISRVLNANPSLRAEASRLSLIKFTIPTLKAIAAREVVEKYRAEFGGAKRIFKPLVRSPEKSKGRDR